MTHCSLVDRAGVQAEAEAEGAWELEGRAELTSYQMLTSISRGLAPVAPVPLYLSWVAPLASPSPPMAATVDVAMDE